MGSLDAAKRKECEREIWSLKRSRSPFERFGIFEIAARLGAWDGEKKTDTQDGIWCLDGIWQEDSVGEVSF